ncbi:response regulator transcription factor [Fictibacillus sp. WQ 8-8]|uniref:response regulator transcription factor n=1 Tax=Fictibacillus sp. WQ 8-8 TaxID=2938788 RepID=UPI0021098C82|nr:response regulator transcription factor [Fictibacillus sp. WQ 8-8]MCQ6264079.1 response regulator transcription factor [Fictibacillus sp. WQ 8-8]
MWKAVIVDDDRQVLKGMKKAIPWEKLGIDCVGEGTDGEMGLQVIMKTQPDIILTDVYMPVMNGLEMLQRVREEGLKGKAIILSGYSDFEYARTALRLNVHDYLSKPVTIQTIESVLSAAVTELEEEKDSWDNQEGLKDELEYYKSLISNDWLKSVMIGIEDQELIHMSQQNINLRERKHLVIGIKLKKTQKLNTVSNATWSVFQKALNHIQSEIVFSPLKSVDWIELNHYHSAILLSYERDSESKLCMDLAQEIAGEIMKHTQKLLSISFQIGIGSLKEDWHEISKSTEEAIHTASRSLPNSIERYEELVKKEGIDPIHKSNEVQSPFQFYRDLAEAVKHYQKDHAIKIAVDFVKECKETNNYLSSQVKTLGKELWLVFTYCLYDNGINLENLFEEKSISKQTEGLNNLELFENWLVEKIKVICSHNQMDEKENIRHKQAVEYMIQYIHTHYSENITLNELSEQVYISRNYLSQIFKKNTGLSFNHYVNKVRMDIAKNLIIEGQHLIYEVAEKVGFKNTPYFSSLFKKYTGLNPTDLLKQ